MNIDKRYKLINIALGAAAAALLWLCYTSIAGETASETEKMAGEITEQEEKTESRDDQ